MPFFGLILHLQHMGSNVFLFQVIFGMVNLPASYIAFLALNHMGRRVSQMLFMSVLGISILTTTFLPEGEKRAQVEERKYLRDLGTQRLDSHKERENMVLMIPQNQFEDSG